MRLKAVKGILLIMSILVVLSPMGASVGVVHSDGKSRDFMVQPTADRSASASVEPLALFRLEITMTRGGTVSPSSGTYTYTEGTTVTVTASPFINYVFHHWELDGSRNYSNPINVAMDTDHALHAVFDMRTRIHIRAHTFTYDHIRAPNEPGVNTLALLASAAPTIFILITLGIGAIVLFKILTSSKLRWPWRLSKRAASRNTRNSHLR